MSYCANINEVASATNVPDTWISTVDWNHDIAALVLYGQHAGLLPSGGPVKPQANSAAAPVNPAAPANSADVVVLGVADTTGAVINDVLPTTADSAPSDRPCRTILSV